MDMHLLFKGFVIGLSIAAPVGPIGILCIRQTVAEGRISGLATGMGAALADSLYASIAGLGLTTISAFLLGHLAFIRLLGGFFLFFLGIKTFRNIPIQKPDLDIQKNLVGKFFSTFILTLSNPMTILAFAAVFTGFGLLKDSHSQISPGTLILGVFLGSASWWLTLTTVVSLIRQHLNFAKLIWINRVSGILIFLFGIISIISLLK